MTEPDGREADIDIFNEPLPANENQQAARTEPRETERSDGIPNDHQLLGAYLQGDEQAFEILVDKHFRMVYTVAERRTGDSHLAEEIAQSVFLILSRKADGFSAKSSVPGWLMQTTRFVCRDAIKMRRRRDENERRLAMAFEHQHESNPAPSNMEVLLEEAIQTLKPDEQAGIVARFFEGKDFQEMAKMFAISEYAVRKRTARCLAKLQNFMAKRGAKVALPTLIGLLMTPKADAATSEALKSALRATNAAWKGGLVAEQAGALADHTLRRLRYRFLARLSLKVALPVLFIFVGLWSVWEWNRPVTERIERLGRAWGALDQQVAEHRRFLMQTPPNTANYQARVQEEMGAISRASSRIFTELNPLLALPDERTHLAEFLTAELEANLNLEPSRKTALFSYIQSRLAQGATLKDSMKALAQTTQTEAVEIRAMLSPGQRQLFDQIYGANGTLLFTYAKVVSLVKIGP
jgi:RNA polymerase sigma-70 factor (ECF subfamily)